MQKRLTARTGGTPSPPAAPPASSPATHPWLVRRWFTPSGDKLAASSGGAEIPRLGRHSFVAADPIHSIVVPQAGDFAACSPN